MKTKLLLPSMWRLKIGWDNKLPPLQAKYWEKWLKNLFNINQVHVPRCYNNLNKDEVAYEFHVFSDASELAYGAVAYLNLVFSDGTSTLSFLMWKLRLAPVKTVSLPRLELDAAVVGVPLLKSLRKRLAYHSAPSNIGQIQHWCYTDKSHRFKVYVSN